MNRATEYLTSALASFPLLHDRWGWKSKHFVTLALQEVAELEERVQQLERERVVTVVLSERSGQWISKR